MAGLALRAELDVATLNGAWGSGGRIPMRDPRVAMSQSGVGFRQYSIKFMRIPSVCIRN